MAEGENSKSIDLALARWRESCLFYFKFDLALVAAIAAAVSFFKLEGDSLLQQAAEYQLIIESIIILIIYAITLELAITTVRNDRTVVAWIGDEPGAKWLLRIFSLLYTIQATGHIMLIIYVFGFGSGYLNSFVLLHHLQNE